MGLHIGYKCKCQQNLARLVQFYRGMAIGAEQQAVPDHSEEAQLHQGTHRSLGFGLLAPALALVSPLDPPLGLTAAHASRVRPGTCFRGLPCSRPNLFSVAFTSGGDAGSGCWRGFGGANHPSLLPACLCDTSPEQLARTFTLANDLSGGTLLLRPTGMFCRRP